MQRFVPRDHAGVTQLNITPCNLNDSLPGLRLDWVHPSQKLLTPALSIFCLKADGRVPHEGWLLSCIFALGVGSVLGQPH